MPMPEINIKPLNFQHLKHLVQLADAPLLSLNISGTRQMICERLVLEELARKHEGRYFIAERGLERLNHLIDKLNGA